MTAIANAKVTIVGAGAVGSATAYATLIRGAARNVVLYDINAARVTAEALDLAHGAMFTGSSAVIGTSDIADTAGSHVIIVTAGAAQKPGQTRLELIETNARIFQTMIPELVEASPEAIVIIVTNPCDVLTMLAVEQTGADPARMFASGCVLDTSRLRWLLAERAGVATTSVHAYIAGEHGDTEFPLWSTARIGPVPLLEWTRDGRRVFSAEELDGLAHEVRTAAYRIIEGKGATNYAIGLSATRIAEAVLRDENAILPVSTVLGSVQGIDGVAMSVPCVVGRGGATPIAETEMSQGELDLFRASAETLRSTADRIRG
ncbi:L-lactate dehydrogenase [Microbacterium excoecariae]|uniref:L-lactate dehydrogenase n=1 Tax=Microbacterium excoecariae TaxID=2715210 RepID=UPI001408E98A|nr:L-lactate dehydrogenase [Microbacterium excoecariae]NHI15644.1 L-lactate dehydrogenase [Microbacterium excoecariae]